MNMTRKRSPRKKRNENGIHFYTMKWWMFSSAFFGILIITLSDATSVTLQNTTQQNQEQVNSTDNADTYSVTNVTDDTTKLQSDKLFNTTISLNETQNLNNIPNQSHSIADNVTGAIRAGNNSNLVEIHIRVIDKNDPINGAPLSDIEKYKYDIDTEFSTQYETIYNNNFFYDLDTSTEYEIITDNDIFDNDPETTTDYIITTTGETVTESKYKSAIAYSNDFQDELLEAYSTEKNAKNILNNTSAVTVLNETLLDNKRSLKKEENVTTHNVYENNDCSKFKNCSNATNPKVGGVLNITSSDTAEIDSKPQEIATVKNELKYIDSNSDENLVGDVDMVSIKQFKLNKEADENSTKQYLKKEKLQHTTKKYYSHNENANTEKKIVDKGENKTIISGERRSSEIVEESSEIEEISKLTTMRSVQLLVNSTEQNILNISTENNNVSVVSTPKSDIKISEELKNITNVINDSLLSESKNVTIIKVDLKNSTRLKIEHKNVSSESDELKTISKAKGTVKSVALVKNSNGRRKNGEKEVSREVTTEDDYNTSYEADEEDDDIVSINGQKAVREPLDMGPFGAIRDFAGSLVESLVERIIPKGIRDLVKRMQNQNEQLETIKLRSREENGGLGQFGRSLLKGLTQPLNQWMQGVRDYGSLDSDRNFFSDVASGVASVADSVGDAFKDRVKAIFPGTLWCGDGDMAKSAEVGLFFMTDTCCRRHDACRLSISAGDTKYGLTNTGLFTRSHCECDKVFYRCLKRTNSLISSQIGVTYFSILGPQCFKREHPIMRCRRRTRLTGQKCEEYDLDHSQPKMWQWFDTETF